MSTDAYYLLDQTRRYLRTLHDWMPEGNAAEIKSRVISDLDLLKTQIGRDVGEEDTGESDGPLDSSYYYG